MGRASALEPQILRCHAHGESIQAASLPPHTTSSWWRYTSADRPRYKAVDKVTFSGRVLSAVRCCDSYLYAPWPPVLAVRLIIVFDVREMLPDANTRGSCWPVNNLVVMEIIPSCTASSWYLPAPVPPQYRADAKEDKNSVILSCYTISLVCAVLWAKRGGKVSD